MLTMHMGHRSLGRRYLPVYIITMTQAFGADMLYINTADSVVLWAIIIMYVSFSQCPLDNAPAEPLYCTAHPFLFHQQTVLYFPRQMTFHYCALTPHEYPTSSMTGSPATRFFTSLNGSFPNMYRRFLARCTSRPALPYPASSYSRCTSLLTFRPCVSQDMLSFG